MNVDQKDLLGGVLLCVIGIAVVGYTFTELKMGTIRSMGPGMFPAALGAVLAVIGFLIALFSPRGERPVPKPEIRSLLAVVAGLSAFALTIDRFGLLAAIALLTIISSFASRKLTPKHIVILFVVLTLLAWLIFIVGFGMPIHLVEWPS